MSRRRSSKASGNRRGSSATGALERRAAGPRAEAPGHAPDAAPDGREADGPASDASTRVGRAGRRRGQVTQALRRSLLALSLLSIFVLPLAALAGAEAHGGAAVLVGTPGPGPGLARALPGLAAVSEVVSGSVWSITVAGLDLADPLAAVLVAASGRTGVLLAAALLPVAATLLLGRVFCGWLCPARLPVELAAWARRRRGRRLVLRAPWLRPVKYGVLAAGLLLAALLGWNLLALVYPPAVLVREGQHLLAYGTMGWGAVVLGGAFAADLFVQGGAWCRGLCPGGALYSLLARPALVRVRLDAERCVRCGRCEAACPLGLDPTTEPGGECDRCGLCERECRDDALRFRLGLPFGRRDGRR